MEFWGVEVKPGETVKCEPGLDMILHISQASLGETKKDKGSENVPLFVKINDQKLVIGTLSADKCAQISYDLVFEKDFELSHASKSASVYFVGYRTEIMAGGPEDFGDFDSDSDDDAPVGISLNGNANVKREEAKPAKSEPKKEAAATEPKQEEDEDDDDDESDEDDSDDEDMALIGADSSEDEEDSSDDEDEDEDEEATPKKAEVGKKRPANNIKTPAPEKKAKVVSPALAQKSGGEGKKGGAHTATPHPAKQVAKTPKSGGSVTCKSCSKTFNSDNALQAHSKAKHGAAAAAK